MASPRHRRHSADRAERAVRAAAARSARNEQTEQRHDRQHAARHPDPEHDVVQARVGARVARRQAMGRQQWELRGLRSPSARRGTRFRPRAAGQLSVGLEAGCGFHIQGD